MRLENVYIENEHLEAAFNAINEMHTDENLLKYASGGRYCDDVERLPVNERRWYAWVNNPENDKFQSLEQALSEWNFEGYYDDEANFIIDKFTGEKWGDEGILFQFIAEYINPEAEIYITGEDEDKFKWSFKNKVFLQERAVVVYV
jgi:hypothetical protein